jgi:subtilisin-like proprotein convertase family protein
VGSSGDFVTRKYSPTGTLLWTDTYDSSLQDTPTAIAADAAGQVWVTGFSDTNGPPRNIVTIKYAADGTRLWVRSSDETNTLGYDYIAVTVDALGNSYVAGISGSSDPSFVAIKYDSGGAPVWIRRYAAVTGSVAAVNHIALDSARNLLVLGNMRRIAGPTKLVFLKYNESGDLVSAAVNDLETSSDFVKGAAADADGNACVTAAVWHGAWRQYYYFTAKYSPEGALVWSVLRPPAYGRDAIPGAVKFDAGGDVIVTGYETRPVDEDADAYYAVTIKYSPNGTQLWSARSTFQRKPRSLALDGDGNIYVAGEIDPYFSPGGPFLLKYAPNGSQLWFTNLPSVSFQQFALNASGELYLADGIFIGSPVVEIRKFLQTPVPSQPTAIIVPALSEVLAGSSVTLTSVVSGEGPFRYQWLYLGYYRRDETNATLTITNAQFQWGSQGDYSVIVSNATAYTISPEARVTILFPPGVWLQSPSNQYASVGQQVTFGAYASGTEPIFFQWYFNGSPIFGATSNVFTILNTQASDAGNYAVVVTNGFGTATSGVSRLVLVLPPISNTNPAAIQIHSNNVVPYPSEILVQGATGSVLKVTVTLCGLNHPAPGDLAVLVQGPTGQSVILMSDISESGPASNITLTFDDEAPDLLNDDSIISSGTFKPSNFGADPLPPPAPSPSSWDVALSAFSGTDPNGTWRLFVSNAFTEEGDVACGWQLTILIADPAANSSSSIKSMVRTGNRIVLGWDGVRARKLQRSSSLINPIWTDVRGSEGSNSIELPINSSNEFFRLVGP